MNIAQNLPSIQTLTRRSLLAGLPAAAVAPASMATSAADPHPHWLNQWRRTITDLNVAANMPGAGDMDTPECLTLEARRSELEALLIDTPVKSSAGAAAQIEFALEDLEIAHSYLDGRDERMFLRIVDLLKGTAA